MTRLALLHSAMNWELQRRAKNIATRLLPYLPEAGRVLDVGCGTGHNVHALSQLSPLQFVELDVTNMKHLGPDPVLFDGLTFPFRSHSFECTLLLFVLHYVHDPVRFLIDIRRVTQQRLLVMQSVFEDRLAYHTLRGRELLTGRTALRIARRIGYISSARNTLQPRNLMTFARLDTLFHASGWKTEKCEDVFMPGIRLSKSLYILSPR